MSFYQRVNHHFLIVFLWFSVVVLWFSYGFPTFLWKYDEFLKPPKLVPRQSGRVAESHRGTPHPSSRPPSPGGGGFFGGFVRLSFKGLQGFYGFSRFFKGIF